MFAGFALLFVFNVAATQYIAWRYAFQPALGRPLLVTSHGSLYQPFAWSIWVLRYVGSRNPQVRFPVQVGVLIVCGGCCLTIGMAFLMNIARTKALTRNSEDVHGSARWANDADLKETGLLDTVTGAYVGGWRGSGEILRYLR